MLRFRLKDNEDTELKNKISLDDIQWFIDVYYSISWINIITNNNSSYPIKMDCWNVVVNLELFREEFLKKGNSVESFIYNLFCKAEYLNENYLLEKWEETKQMKFRYDRIEKFRRAWNKAKALHHLEDSFRFLYFYKKIIQSISALELVWKEIFDKTNFKDQPKHLQFLNALVREIAIPDEKCIIDDNIRAIVDTILRTWFIKDTIKWELVYRIRIIWRRIEPFYMDFLERDIRDNKVNEDDLWRDENDDEEEEEEPNKDTEEDKEDIPEMPERPKEYEKRDLQEPWWWGGWWEEWEPWKKKEEPDFLGNQWEWNTKPSWTDDDLSEQDNENQQEQETKQMIPDFSDENSDEDLEWEEENNPFDDIYENEEISDMLQNMPESETDDFKDSNDKGNENTENKDTNTIRDGDKKQYEYFLKELEWLTDSETWKSISKSIADLCLQVIANRITTKKNITWTSRLSSWRDFYDPSIPTAVTDIINWREIEDPFMCQRIKRREKKENLPSDIELTVIWDWSGSMNTPDEKRIYQKYSFFSIFEWFEEFKHQISRIKKKLIKPITVHTEWFMFVWKKQKNQRNKWSNAEVIKLKELWPDLLEEEKIEAFNALDKCNWTKTNDYDWIQSVIEYMEWQSDEYREKIKSGEIKKIVTVLTDGESSNKVLMKKKIAELRSLWVIVYWIGITKSAGAVVELFASGDSGLWKWLICENPTKIPMVLRKLFAPHIK